MSDQNVREIQLGGKQLVFLFMASVVLAVAIFLLGISVGRGAQQASADPAAGQDVAAADREQPLADMPPKTETTPVDLRYHDKLQGQTPPPAQPVPEPKPAEPASAVSAPPTPGPAPQSPQAATSGRSAAAAPSAGGTSAAAALKPQEKPSAKPSQPVPKTGWFVQVNAFKSKANADKQVTELKAKGHPSAFVLSEPTGSLFRVRVGPIADRAEAERLAQRLKSEVGGSPTVQP